MEDILLLEVQESCQQGCKPLHARKQLVSYEDWISKSVSQKTCPLSQSARLALQPFRHWAGEAGGVSGHTEVAMAGRRM